MAFAILDKTLIGFSIGDKGSNPTQRAPQVFSALSARCGDARSWLLTHFSGNFGGFIAY